MHSSYPRPSSAGKDGSSGCLEIGTWAQCSPPIPQPPAFGAHTSFVYKPLHAFPGFSTVHVPALPAGNADCDACIPLHMI
mmetsp:Transcript_13483/g.24074  ORF Transcript_13483/g.24074 Transcript_13483/m.24074 type:complete len:80 (+) Transcript_13483:1368-1607(+)